MDPCFNLNLSASINLIIKGLHSVDRLERWVKPRFAPSGPQKYIAKESDGIDNHSILFGLNLSIALRNGLTAQNFKRDWRMHIKYGGFSLRLELSSKLYKSSFSL